MPSFLMFEIHSRNGCTFCDKLMAFMDQQNIPYTEVKLERDFFREEFVNRFGRDATFPRVIHDGTVIGGMKETVAYLKANDYV